MSTRRRARTANNSTGLVGIGSDIILTKSGRFTHQRLVVLGTVQAKGPHAGNGLEDH